MPDRIADSLARDLVQLGDVGAEDLHRDVAAHAADHLLDAHVDRLREAERQSRKLGEHLAELLQQRGLVGGLPLLRRLQDQERVGLVRPHRVEAELVGAGARDDAGDIRHLARMADWSLALIAMASSRLTDGSASTLTMMSPSSIVGMNVLPSWV